MLEVKKLKDFMEERNIEDGEEFDQRRNYDGSGVRGRYRAF